MSGKHQSLASPRKATGSRKAKVGPQQQLATLLQHYRSHPMDFITQVIGVEPTAQQKELILLACEPGSRVAVKSCTASGKTAALTWLTLYFLICFPNTKMVVTAPTAQQLHRVFRSELLLWQSRMKAPFGDFYEIMTDNVHIKGKKGLQFCSFVTGSSDNKESFAGIHADKVVLMVDEASALDSEIFDTLLGTLSKGETHFVLVSNPVRGSGAFYDLFQNKENWETLTFTSFGSPNVDKEWIEEILNHYGEDSDYYRMRVLGEFPILDSAQFIPTDTVDRAMTTVLTPPEYQHFSRVLGVDVARFGNDASVIVDRQGPRVHDIFTFRGLDTVEFTGKVLAIYKSNSYSSVFVDGIGIGAGVVDQLKRFNVPVIDVVVSQKSTDPKSYFNLRSQIYGRMRDWLETASMGPDKELREDLLGINYSFNNKLQIILESKKDMKKRGISSPDRGDALALTFAQDIYQQGTRRPQARAVRQVNYLWA